MQNIAYKIDKDTLTITVDLKQRHGVSNSGATVTVAATQGNVKIGHGDIAFGLSVYTKEGLAAAQLAKAKEHGFKTFPEYLASVKAAKAALLAK